MKPPKQWFHEGTGQKKSGRDAAKDDSFRSYMVLKIKRQEEQFGLQTPPTPESPFKKEKSVTFEKNEILNQTVFRDENEEPKSLNGLVRSLQTKRRKSGAKAKLERRKKRKKRSEANRVCPDLDASTSNCTLGHTKQEKHEEVDVDLDLDRADVKSNSMRKRRRPDLFFQGVTILVNGYTNSVDDETLKRLIHKHGGNFVKYELSTVTHIIAECLSEAKAKVYRKKRNSIPVVKPEWILDSVSRGYRLPHADYLLTQVRDTNAHSSMDDYFSKKISSELNSDIPEAEEIEKQKQEKHSVQNPYSPAKTTRNIETTMNRKWSPSDGPRTTGNDPKFLTDYFANSRLSFIGSHKQRNYHEVPRRSFARSSNLQRFIFHVDLDCFFANVALRTYPEYRDFPVAIGHVQRIPPFTNENEKKHPSNSELSTCNYIARRFGVKKGMFLSKAVSLCPGLVVLPYDFVSYEQVSETVSDILNQYVDNYEGVLEQVSCDESYCEFYLDPSDTNAIEEIAGEILHEIKAQTACTASIGIGTNKLLAKLATNKAKEKEGNCFHIACHWKEFLKGLELKEIPGIGWKLDKELRANYLFTVDDIWDISESDLCGIIGLAKGKKLFNFCHGKDDREVKAAERKTVSAECNYGVRFENSLYGVDYMVKGLAEEVEKRMAHLNVLGRHLTLKVKERVQGAPPPGKFNGHGKCHDHSKSCSLPSLSATRDSSLIASECMRLYLSLGLDKNDIRGMGITISKLEYEDAPNVETKSLMSEWLTKTSRANEIESNQKDNSLSHPSLVGDDSDSISRTDHGSSNDNTCHRNLSWSNASQIEGDKELAKQLAAEWKLEDQKRALRPRKKRVALTRKRPKDPSQSILNFIAQPQKHVSFQLEALPPSQTQTNNEDIINDFVVFDRKEDLNFLDGWMTSIPTPSKFDVDQMGEYLCHCMKCLRTEDTIYFLRHIKNRKDDWGLIHYSSILSRLQHWLRSHRGTVLDVEWHGL